LKVSLALKKRQKKGEREEKGFRIDVERILRVFGPKCMWDLNFDAVASDALIADFIELWSGHQKAEPFTPGSSRKRIQAEQSQPK